ncbi:MAG: hypothetical protein ABI474_06680, partial [Actinomycetota bacterium]
MVAHLAVCVKRLRQTSRVRFNGHMGPSLTYRVCVICSGNICRSPMGEVIMRS